MQLVERRLVGVLRDDRQHDVLVVRARAMHGSPRTRRSGGAPRRPLPDRPTRRGRAIDRAPQRLRRRRVARLRVPAQRVEHADGSPSARTRRTRHDPGVPRSSISIVAERPDDLLPGARVEVVAHRRRQREIRAERRLVRLRERPLVVEQRDLVGVGQRGESSCGSSRASRRRRRRGRTRRRPRSRSAARRSARPRPFARRASAARAAASVRARAHVQRHAPARAAPDRFRRAETASARARWCGCPAASHDARTLTTGKPGCVVQPDAMRSTSLPARRAQRLPQIAAGRVGVRARPHVAPHAGAERVLAEIRLEHAQERLALVVGDRRSRTTPRRRAR